MCDGDLEALVRALQDNDAVAENICIFRNRLTLADGRFAKALVRNKTVVELELLRPDRCRGNKALSGRDQGELYPQNNIFGRKLSDWRR